MVGGPWADDEPWPDEPDDPGSPDNVEPDPLEDIGPDVPEVDIPQPPDKSEVDAPANLIHSFWKLVAVFNLALFAASLGPMLVFFRGEWTNGTAVFLLGVACFAYGYVRYKRTKAAHASDDRA